MEGAEGEEPRCVGHDLLRFGDFQDFDIPVLHLHDAIVGAPWMLVPRANREAEARIELAGSFEVAHRVNDMVQTVGHAGSLTIDG